MPVLQRCYVKTPKSRHSKLPAFKGLGPYTALPIHLTPELQPSHAITLSVPVLESCISLPMFFRLICYSCHLHPCGRDSQAF